MISIKNLKGNNSNRYLMLLMNMLQHYFKKRKNLNIFLQQLQYYIVNQ